LSAVSWLALVASENRHVAELSRTVTERISEQARAVGVAASVSSPQLKRLKLVEGFTRETRLHDLCILDSESDAIDIDRDLIEAALLDSGRPVIVVPPGFTSFSARRVVVAWDGSSKAARALFYALPILRIAEMVEVIQIEGEKDLSGSIPSARLVEHLLSHKVKIIAKTIHADNGERGPSVQTVCRALGCRPDRDGWFCAFADTGAHSGGA